MASVCFAVLTTQAITALGEELLRVRGSNQNTGDLVCVIPHHIPQVQCHVWHRASP